MTCMPLLRTIDAFGGRSAKLFMKVEGPRIRQIAATHLRIAPQRPMLGRIFSEINFLAFSIKPFASFRSPCH
jgi:hypothetical protein